MMITNSGRRNPALCCGFLIPFIIDDKRCEKSSNNRCINKCCLPEI